MWWVVVLGGVLTVLSVPYIVYILGYWSTAPEGSPADKGDATPAVSIVLPTYNEDEIVSGKLERLARQTYPTEKLEVVVADDSTDRTPERVRSFAEDSELGVKLVRGEDRRGVASAVNDALDAASNDLVFRTDCDARLGDDAIEHAVANLQDERIGGVTGRQTEVIGDSDVETEYRGLQERNQAFESALDSTLIVHGPCFAFERELFRPLPPDTVADDTEIGVGIRKAGKRVVMDPAMEFAEAGISDVRARRQRKDRRAVGLLQLLFRHTDLLGRYGWYGRFIVPTNWWFMVVSPWASALVFVLATALSVLSFGPLGLGVPVASGAFVLLGHRDFLGPLQPVYSVVDAHISLCLATIQLFTRDTDGTWDVDEESREHFES